MAHKLKFGGGTWATQKGSTLAYNDENDRYKPLPFTTARNSIATRVNKEGLIEVVGSDIPRIDYKDSEDGALLLEPQRTNYITQSNDFSVWSVADVTVNSSYGLSPDGSNNSSLITEGTGSAQHRILTSNPASSGIYTFSCFVKNKVGSHQAYIDMGAVTGFFDFDTKTMYSAAGTTNIESWSNDWYRISITSNSNITPVASYIGIGKNNTETFQGDGSSAIEFFGVQLEQSSYATSYIPTQGSTVTRQADTASGAGNSAVFNGSEGVLFANIAANSNDGSLRTITLGDNSSSNAVSFRYDNPNQITLYLNSGGVSQFSTAANAQILSFNKCLIKYKANDFSAWVNGFEVGNQSSGSTFTSGTLDRINFDIGYTSTDPFYGKAKEIAYYDTILTDEELEYMTSYRTLRSMVKELNLNEL